MQTTVVRWTPSFRLIKLIEMVVLCDIDILLMYTVNFCNKSHVNLVCGASVIRENIPDISFLKLYKKANFIMLTINWQLV